MLSYLILFVTVLVIRARPLDSNQTRSGGGDSPRRAPEFLLQMQSCMNIKGREMRRACLNFTEKDQDLVERITNAVWGSVGNGSLENKISFKISKKVMTIDVHSVDLVFYKDSISETRLEELSTNSSSCNLSRDGLLLKLMLNETTLRTLHLTTSHLLVNKWIVFHHLKGWYIDWLQKKAPRNTSIAEDEIYIHLKVEMAPDCSDVVSLTDLGVRSSEGYKPLLVIYARPLDKDKEQLTSKFMNQLLPNMRKKRSEEITTGSGTYPTTDSNFGCTLQTYEVSYKHIHSPALGTFEMNFCTGVCHYPLEGIEHTIHASLAAWLNSITIKEKPPKPSCIPIEYQYIVALLEEATEVYGLFIIPGMTALRCGCR